MIRKKQQKSTRWIIIDLTGSQGNAFFLLGQAQTLARQLGYTEEQREALLDDMRSGDYENLIQTFDDHFGSFVILER